MFPYKIDFPDTRTSDALRNEIIKRTEKLERFYDRITSCHVAVRVPNKHHRQRFFHVIIRLEVPGKFLIANQEPEMNYAHTNPKIAIRDAFAKITRQLEDHIKERRERPRSQVSANENGQPLQFNAKG